MTCVHAYIHTWECTWYSWAGQATGQMVETETVDWLAVRNPPAKDHSQSDRRSSYIHTYIYIYKHTYELELIHIILNSYSVRIIQCTEKESSINSLWKHTYIHTYIHTHTYMCVPDWTESRWDRKAKNCRKTDSQRRHTSDLFIKDTQILTSCMYVCMYVCMYICIYACMLYVWQPIESMYVLYERAISTFVLT